MLDDIDRNRSSWPAVRGNHGLCQRPRKSSNTTAPTAPSSA